MKRELYEQARQKALEMYEKAHIVLTPREKENLEVADLGLGDLWNTGLEIVTYVNTERCCAKEMVLFPHQTCPEHRHAPLPGYPGKEETFRCRYGTVYLYVEGEPADSPLGETARRQRSVLHGVARDRAAGGRSIYHDARYLALVPGRGRWCGGVGIQHQKFG